MSLLANGNFTSLAILRLVILSRYFLPPHRLILIIINLHH
jgi:hypothetical protein